MKQLKILWAFTRPHTIIGSFFSITALYLIAIAISFPNNKGEGLQLQFPHLLLTLISSLACNIYITGLNQLQDIEIDKLNKPWLPIPAGKLSEKKAGNIIIVCGLIALTAAAMENIILLVLILLIMGIGTAYSLPPLKFKRHHLAAAASILMVRGILVNAGMLLQFNYAFTKNTIIPKDAWPLTFFVMGFSLAIAWFKDIPDTGGDKQFNIKTLAITLSPKAAFNYGVAVVLISYSGMLLWAAFSELGINHLFFFGIHALLMLLFMVGATTVKIEEIENLKRSYLVFWGFFFAEYIVYGASYYV